MNLSDPILLDLKPRAWVYRLWNADGDCLYVGQHRGFNPATRITKHSTTQPWWNEVTRADYVEVLLEGDLDIAEKQQIHDLNARYNRGGWTKQHPDKPLTGKTINVLPRSLTCCAGPRARSARRTLSKFPHGQGVKHIPGDRVNEIIDYSTHGVAQVTTDGAMSPAQRAALPTRSVPQRQRIRERPERVKEDYILTDTPTEVEVLKSRVAALEEAVQLLLQERHEARQVSG